MISLLLKLINWIRMGLGRVDTLAEGRTAPDFELARPEGGTLSLAEILSAGPVLLAFYKVSCPTCQFTLPYLQRLRGGPFQIFAICQDDAERAAEFASVFEMDLPTLLDRADKGYPVSNTLGLTHVPSLFLVEQDRHVSWASIGFNKAQLESLAERAGHAIFSPEDQVPESKFG